MSGYPKEKRSRKPNRPGWGRWFEAQVKNCSSCLSTGVILNSSTEDNLRLAINFCQQRKLLTHPILEQWPATWTAIRHKDPKGQPNVAQHKKNVQLVL